MSRKVETTVGNLQEYIFKLSIKNVVDVFPRDGPESQMLAYIKFQLHLLAAFSRNIEQLSKKINIPQV